MNAVHHMISILRDWWAASPPTDPRQPHGSTLAGYWRQEECYPNQYADPIRSAEIELQWV